MKKPQQWWEGAQWVAELIGQSEGPQALQVCHNIECALADGDHPIDYREGARAAVKVARAEAEKFVQK